jgi:hypothetical protein
MRSRVALACVCLTAASFCFGQDSSLDRALERAAKTTEERRPEPRGGDLVSGILTACQDPNSQIKGCDDIRSAVFKQQKDLLEYNVDVFRWQGFSTKVMFWIVILLTLSGLAFAGVQFWLTFRHYDPRKHPEAPKMDAEAKVSASGLEFKTPVLGVTVLFISMAFLFLYMRYVYPIEETMKKVELVEQGKQR